MLSRLPWALAVLVLSACNLDALSRSPVAYSCTRDGGDPTVSCAAGWRCGEGDRCFDPTEAMPRVCWADADCAAGWRCGLSVAGVRHCQDTATGASYPCADDTNCEQGWRCDPLMQVCTQVTDQVGLGHAQVVATQLLSPLLDAGVPVRVAAGQEVQQQLSSNGSSYLRPFAFQTADTLYLLLVGDNLPVSGASGGSRPVLVDTLPVSGGVADLAVLGPWLFVRGTDGSLRARSSSVMRGMEGDGGSSDPIVFFPSRSEWLLADAGVTALQAINATPLGQNPWVLAAQKPPGALLRYDLDTNTGALHVSAVGVVAGGLDIAPVAGMVSLPETGDAGVAFLLTQVGQAPTSLATTAQGSDGGLVSLAIEGTDAGFSPRRVLVTAGTQSVPAMLLAVGVTDGGAPTRWAPLEGYTEHPGLSWELRVDGDVAGAPVCPLERTPLFIMPLLWGSARPDALVRCPLVYDAGIPAATWLVSFDLKNQGWTSRFTQIDEGSSPYDFGMRASLDMPRTHMGSGGHLWFAPEANGGLDNLTRLQPVLLDRAPTMVARLETRGVRALYASTGDSLFGFSDDYGFGWTNTALPFYGPVAGHSQWGISTRVVYDLSRFPLGSEQPLILAELPATSPDMTSPASGATVVMDDGRVFLTVTSGDTVYVANIAKNLASDYAAPAVLTPRVVPSPGIALQSIALRQVTDGGVLEGYGLTGSEVFELTASTINRWSSRRIRFAGGLPVRVWTEDVGDGGLQWRLGTSSGHVRSLPISVPLTDRLPGGAVDFGRMCGSVFAIAPAPGSGLFQLVAGDAGVGTWAPVTVDAIDREWAQAQLLEAKDSLFVATASGRVAEVAMGFDGGLPVSCP
jgi:hypothetical protein